MVSFILSLFFWFVADFNGFFSDLIKFRLEVLCGRRSLNSGCILWIKSLWKGVSRAGLERWNCFKDNEQ